MKAKTSNLILKILEDKQEVLGKTPKDLLQTTFSVSPFLRTPLHLVTSSPDCMCQLFFFRDVPELNPARYGIPESGQSYNLSGILHVGQRNDRTTPRENATIETILAHLKKSYCGRIAFEVRTFYLCISFHIKVN